MTSYKKKYPITHSIKELYNLYKEDRIDNNKEYVSRTLFRKICYTLNLALSKAIIEESLEFKMPWKMGHLRIKKNRIKYKIKDGKIVQTKGITDWGNSRKLWYKLYNTTSIEELKKIKNKPLIFYSNYHTNGYIMRWYWDKRLCSVKNKTVYVFRPVKYNRLRLKEYILNKGGQRYEE